MLSRIQNNSYAHFADIRTAGVGVSVGVLKLRKAVSKQC